MSSLLGGVIFWNIVTLRAMVTRYYGYGQVIMLAMRRLAVLLFSTLLAQARLFLWTQYRNLGGLFYRLVNKHHLYLADEQEILALSI